MFTHPSIKAVVDDLDKNKQPSEEAVYQCLKQTAEQIWDWQPPKNGKSSSFIPNDLITLFDSFSSTETNINRTWNIIRPGRNLMYAEFHVNNSIDNGRIIKTTIFRKKNSVCFSHDPRGLRIDTN